MPNFSAAHEGCDRVLVVLELHLSRHVHAEPGRLTGRLSNDNEIREDIVHAFLHRQPGATTAVHLPSDGHIAIRRIVRERPIGPEEPPNA
jgi:hypothetical protein